MTDANWSHEETDDPLYDDRRNLSGTYRAIWLHDCYSHAKGHVVLSLPASLKTFPLRAMARLVVILPGQSRAALHIRAGPRPPRCSRTHEREKVPCLKTH